MEEEKVEILDDKAKITEKEKKNSVILIFSVLGAIVFMLLIIASIVFLVPFLNGKKTTKQELMLKRLNLNTD